MNSAMPAGKNGIERLAASPRRDQEYDLEDVFKVLRRRLGVIVGTVLVLTTGAALIALNLTPRYTARSTIVVEPRESHIISFEETRQDLPADTSTINTHVKFLTSNSFARPVIERLDLIRNPEFNSALLKNNAPDRVNTVLSEALSWAQLPLVAIGLANQPSSQAQDLLPRGDRSNAEELAVPVDGDEAWVEIPATSGQDEQRNSLAVAENGADDPLMVKITEAFLGQLDVGPSGQSYAISIDFTSVDPETAARVANTMAELYVEYQLGAKQTATTGAVDWLAHRLDELREQLVQSERAAEEYRVDNELAGSGERLEFSDEEVAALTQELIRTQAERVAIQAKLDGIRQVRSSGQSLASVPR